MFRRPAVVQHPLAALQQSPVSVYLVLEGSGMSRTITQRMAFVQNVFAALHCRHAHLRFINLTTYSMRVASMRGSVDELVSEGSVHSGGARPMLLAETRRMKRAFWAWSPSTRGQYHMSKRFIPLATGRHCKISISAPGQNLLRLDAHRSASVKSTLHQQKAGLNLCA